MTDSDETQRQGTASSSTGTSAPPRPTLLQPPSTIISPPSPIDSTHSIPIVSSPAAASSTPGSQEQELQYESPEEDEETEVAPSPRPKPTRRPRSADDSLNAKPMAADALSVSPSRDSSLLLPVTPDAEGNPTIPRPPSPSSPHYRPKPHHHRRTSSTHRVRETVHGEQRNTEDGERMVNQYRIGKSLGKGAYATVELGVDVGTGEEYAIKEFSKSRLHLQTLQQKQRQSTRNRSRRRPQDLDEAAALQPDAPMLPSDSGPWKDKRMRTMEEDPLGLIRREIAVMKKLDHPNIIHLFEAISVPNADALFLVLEYLPGGCIMEIKMGQSAEDAQPPFGLDRTWEYFRQLCLGLEYLHANEVVHRDIKPENILLSRNREIVKLCDFGVSEMFKGDDRIKKAGGSPAFLSPESFTSSPADIHGKAVDIWALGVTLYCLLTGVLPFNVENPIDLFEVVKTKEPVLKDEWSPELKDLLSSMLDKNPDTRSVMEDIRSHAWVTDHGKDEMISKDDNLYFIGKKVEEPTEEEIRSAIISLRSIFTVIRAVQKLKRLRLSRQSSSRENSMSSTASPALGLSSPGASTNPSLYSGSMDSYASHAGRGTESTAHTSDLDNEWKDLGEDTMLSPQAIDGSDAEDAEETQRGMTREGGPRKKAENPFDKLHPIQTDTSASQQPDDETDPISPVMVFDSPTSEDSTPV